MKKRGITCGIHYPAMHLHKVYEKEGVSLPISEEHGDKTVSIPFNEKLTDDQVAYIIKCCEELI